MHAWMHVCMRAHMHIVCVCVHAYSVLDVHFSLLLNSVISAPGGRILG